MAGDIEFGKCDICQQKKRLQIKYYHYDIVCNCCIGQEDNHFEFCLHCSDCEPKPPRTIKLNLKPI